MIYGYTKKQNDGFYIVVTDKPTCKIGHLDKVSGPPSARCRPPVPSYRSISARCTEGFPIRTSSLCPLLHRAVWRLKMAMGKQSAVFTQQRNDVSVLFRRLIESAAQAVLFVSVERKKKSRKKKKLRGGRKHIPHTRGRSHDEFSTADRDRQPL